MIRDLLNLVWVPARNLGDEHADTSPPLSSTYTSPTNITNSTSNQHLLQHHHRYHQQHHNPSPTSCVATSVRAATTPLQRTSPQRLQAASPQRRQRREPAPKRRLAEEQPSKTTSRVATRSERRVPAQNLDDEHAVTTSCRHHRLHHRHRLTRPRL